MVLLTKVFLSVYKILSECKHPDDAGQNPHETAYNCQDVTILNTGCDKKYA
jgi:hypothetical protein